MTIEPTPEQLEAIAADERDGPVVMLNLNRFHERAQYPDGTPDADVSGEDAYQRYGAVAVPAVSQVGGHVLWHTSGEGVVIGTEADDWDEVLAVWYPNRSAFFDLIGVPGYAEALEHRRAGLAEARIIITAGEPKPRLTPVT